MTTWNANNLLGGTQQNMTTTFKTLVNVYATSGALQRTYVSEVSIGASDVPNATDCPVIFDLSLMTAEGTATTVTPNANTVLETGTMAGCRATSKANHTAEPTITSNSSRLAKAMNQRATYRWVAISDDSRIIGPAVASNGWALRAKSTNYASTLLGEIVFQE